MKTSLHLTDEDLSDAKSYAEPVMEQGDNEVVAVMLEEAVKGVEQGSGQEDIVEDLLDMGVEVRACSNSMEEHGIDESDLIEGVETVPAGPAELTRLHDEGYGYLKV